MKEKDTIYENLFRKAAFQDDEEAFRQLFLEFYPALCVFAMRSVYHEEEARDIVQDVFFKIWKNRKSININTSFRNFLITSVRNGCTDYLRRQDIENQYMGKKRLFSIHTSPEELYTLKELESAIAEVLAEMPNNVREAFEMSRFKGMTYTSIAEKMQVSPKSIEVYISKALKILREKLQDYLPLLLLL
jgi:RNA polymerase sigma-70 factor (family 1)